MPNARLKRLTISNFRNIAAQEFEFDGRNCNIIGENHVGKTNTLEAIAFLMTDKLLNGSTDQVQTIRPKDQADLKPEERTPTSVEGVFSIEAEDGTETEFTIKKQYREKWVKERGTAEISFKGYEKVLEINGVKQQTEKEYLKNVREAFGLIADDADKIEYPRLLMIPGYLGDMGEGKDWTYLRAFIIKLVGDIKDSDVFDAHPELVAIQKDLASSLGKVDQLKRRYKQEVDGLQITLAGDDSAIALLSETKKPEDSEVEIAKKEIEELDAEIARLRVGQGSDVASEAIEKQLSSKRAELLNAKEAHIADLRRDPASVQREDLRKKAEEERRTISEQVERKSHKNYEKSNHEWKIKSLEESLAQVSETVNDTMISEIMEIEKKEAEPYQPVCPTCGRPLPEAEAKEAKAKRDADLFKRKQELIDRCRSNKSKREALRTEIQSHKEAIALLLDDISASDTVIEASNFTIKNLEDQIAKLQPAVYEPNAEERRLSDEIKALEENLAESRKAFQSGTYDANTAIYAQQEKKKPYQKVIDDLAYYNRQMEALDVKKQEKGKHQRELIDVEQKRETLNRFIYTKLRMLDDNVAKVFGKIRFKLISENINGGFDPVCKPYIYDTETGESKDVPWFAGSKSEKIETGIAICEAVKAKLRLPDLPYLFDEGGEISTETMAKRLKTDAQIICVKVVDDVMKPTVVPIR